mgnify:CR=1 FL=1
MIIKMKPFLKIALIVTIIWTVIVATLTLNLVISSKRNALSNAKEDAFSAINHFTSTSDWLIKENTHFGKYLLKVEKDSPVDNSVTLFSIEFGVPQVYLIFVKRDHPLHSDEAKLEKWQNYFFGQLRENIQKNLIIEKVDGKEYVRAFESLVINKKCNLCRVVSLDDSKDIIGGVFISVDMSSYLSKSYSHALSMIRNIAILWVLGLAAIIYGYKETSSAVKIKLKNYEESVFNLVDIIEKRDSYTAGHTQRVAKYALLIADKLNVDSHSKDLLYRASMLHDIGKISTPDSILLKPSKLSELEYKIIQNHVTISYEILSKVSIYKDIAEIARHHHEYYDGSGYPQGLKGEQIPFLSQILTVADGFDAMTTDRIYKGRKSVSEAVIEISQLSGRQFNPVIVKAALGALSEVTTERKVSQLPESDLQHERFSYFYKDNVTHAYNQRYLELLLSKQKQELNNYRYAMLIRVHNFSQYNSEFSWNKGDEKLTEIVNSLQNVEENHLVFRVFGDDFILLLKNIIDPIGRKELLKKEVENTCLYYSTRYIDLHETELINMDELEKIMHISE